MELIKGRKYSPKHLGKVCVLGLGATGLAVANFLKIQEPGRIDSIHVYAGEKNEFAMKTADKLLRDGLTVSFDDQRLEHNYDLCIVSPGISNLSELYKSAIEHCAEVISEVELAWRESDVNSSWVAITGTNGKTTTTSLVHHILKENRKRSVAIGNIGNVAIKAIADDRTRSAYTHTDVFVVEVSSYQLASCIRFAPEVSVLLNITPDHIEWHGSFDAYADAKMQIFQNCKTAIVNTSDPEIAKRMDMLNSNDSIEQVIEIGDVESVIDVVINNQHHEILHTDRFKLVGNHNRINAQAACAACLVEGLDEIQIAKALSEFQALEHRLEPCGIIAGTKYFNDSKATNVDAVLVALNSFEDGRAIFLMGGRDKGTDLSDLVKKSVDKLKGVVCFGECRDRFYDAFAQEMKKRGLALDGSLNTRINFSDNRTFVLKLATNFDNAFETARALTYPGDSVVLSPACASFDEFSSFEERGEEFKKLVGIYTR